MTATRAATIATLAAAALAPGKLRAQPLLPDIADYAVLGLGGVSIRRETRVLSGAVGAVAGTIRLGRQSRVTNIVAGPTIRLGVSTRTSTLFCHLASGPPPLPLCNAFADPLVNPALLAPAPVTPGATDLIIPPHSSASPYPAGSFGDVRVGVGSVLQLSGGTYTARSLRIARGGRVVCSTDCRIGVLGLVRLRRGAALGSSAPIQANTARVDVAASGPLPAFVARARTNVSATIFAPAGDVVLGSLGSYRGAFVGRTVVIGPEATVRGDSAL